MTDAPRSHTKFPNGTRKVVPIKSSTIDWYPERQQDVIAIDFGTSTLAVAYKVNGKVEDLRIQEDCTDAYVPTVLLIKQDGTVEIGERALLQYSRLENVDVETCLFFERVKLQLQNDKTVSHATTIQGSDGKEYYVIQVIALILQQVKQRLITYFSTRGKKYTIDEFHWVLTIPALWGERARDMMREAAYLAGLCSNHPKWEELLSLPLKPRRKHSLEAGLIKQYESNPERLSLVYEPDAAAAWCNQLSEEDVRTCSDAAPPVTTDNFFLTIDVGGGTIDVTAHQVLANGRMKRINIPHGEVYGGTIINQAFKSFLETEVVCDRDFLHYLSGNDKAENKAELLGLIYHEFEKTKKIFAESDPKKENCFMVQLPFTFTETYRSSLQPFKANIISKGHDVAYRPRTHQLQISRRKMIFFFEPNVIKLHECIDRARDAIVQEYGDRFEIFYLVGGFGGCRYIADDVREKYKTGSLKVLVPSKHDLAVVRGACVYYEKQVLSSADATYGVGICQTYNPNNPVHARGRAIFDDSGVKHCTNLFQPIVQIGQELKSNCVFIQSLIPFQESDKSVSINVYTGTVEYVDFTIGEDGKKLRKAATLVIDISDGMDLPHHKRMIDVLLDFNGIEIKVYARFRHNSKRVNASIDFLSTLNKFDSI